MTSKRNPKLYELKQLVQEVQQVQAKLKATVQRGLAPGAPEAVTVACTQRARELRAELAGLTWESMALKMQLAYELPTATLGQPGYYYADDLRQWAKVHALGSGRFLFEAFSHDGQGVLAEVGTFQFLAQWKPSTETEYQAMLSHLLDTNGIEWNQTKGVITNNNQND